MADTSETPDFKARKDRSPSSPFISLKKAVERAQSLYDNHRNAPARLVAIAGTWGYALKSSGLQQTASALKQFGLTEETGNGEDRKIQLSELGRRILLDSRPGQKETALREAAIKPRLIAEYLPLWVPDRPNDSHCISDLTLDRGFNQDAAKNFLKVFDETVEYANLKDADKLVSSLPPETVEEKRMVVHLGGTSERDSTGSVGIVRAGVPRATLPLPEGVAAIEIPYGLSQESYEDLEDWVEVLLKRAKRQSERAIPVGTKYERSDKDPFGES